MEDNGKKMTIVISESEGYTRREVWEPTDFYCLNCGKQGVWDCPDNMDYDSGESEHLCTFCEFGGYGTYWSPLNKEDGYVVQRILDPTLSQPKHNPRPLPAHLKRFMEIMFVDFTKERPRPQKGKTVQWLKFPKMKPLSPSSAD